jgi:hypothetical protein
MLVLLAALVALPAHSDGARAIDGARELVNSCRELERGREGAGKETLIPNSGEALLCWGYMQAMQDLSVLVDQRGRRVIGSCPPENTTTLQLVHLFLDLRAVPPRRAQGQCSGRGDQGITGQLSLPSGVGPKVEAAVSRWSPHIMNGDAAQSEFAPGE